MNENVNCPIKLPHLITRHKIMTRVLTHNFLKWWCGNGKVKEKKSQLTLTLFFRKNKDNKFFAKITLKGTKKLICLSWKKKIPSLSHICFVVDSTTHWLPYPADLNPQFFQNTQRSDFNQSSTVEADVPITVSNISGIKNVSNDFRLFLASFGSNSSDKKKLYFFGSKKLQT